MTILAALKIAKPEKYAHQTTGSMRALQRAWSKATAQERREFIDWAAQAEPGDRGSSL
jgi:hypothetical protein